MTVHAYICDAIRTPFGRYGGALAPVRPDDLAAVAIKALVARNPGVRWEELDDAIMGCANQAGEDNRNVARMATLLAGLPIEVPGAGQPAEDRARPEGRLLRRRDRAGVDRPEEGRSRRRLQGRASA
jgi:hypothetical protein